MELTLDAPNARQRAFLHETRRHVAFGGARGGGKSWAVRTKAILLALQYPGIRILIVRKTYKELMNNHVIYLQQTLHDLAVYHRTDQLFRLPGGSTIAFGYCGCDSDLDQYQGAEYDIVFLDEATQLDESWIRRITACVRGVNAFPKRVYYTCNPGGRGHAYIKRLFIDRRYEPGEDPDDYAFIQSLVTDNTALCKAQPDYIRQLEALPPRLRDAWLYGRWDVFEGQFFDDFRDDPTHYDDRRFTHVINPFPPPAGWRVYRSFDFGYAKPFSCAWWAMDFDGRLYRILELYGCTKNPNEGVRWQPEKIFRRIAEIEAEHPWLRGREITGVADPSIWDASRGESISQIAMRCGVYFTPGDNHRLSGWMQCHYRLAFDEDGIPMCYIFNTCKGFCRTIPTLCHSTTDPEDLDTRQEDHIADEWRYLLMSRPIRPTLTPAPTPLVNDPLNQLGALGAGAGLRAR